jgi:hypothetical protein
MLTGKYLSPDSQYIQLIKSEKKSAVEICKDLVTSVYLDEQGYAKSRAAQDDLAATILRRFHLLHQSWSTRVSFTLADMEYPTSSVVDLQVGGNYWTWLLFSEGKKAKDIFTVNITPKTLRIPANKEQWLVEPHPLSKKLTARTARPWSHQPHNIDEPGGPTGEEEKLETWNPDFIPTGDLVGITLANQRAPAEKSKEFQIPAKSFGGGIIGTQSYLMSNTNLFPDVRPDGGRVSHRRFGESIIRDFFCRDLPVLTEADVIPHITPNPDLTFQAIPVCMKCHYTMEPLASGIRNLVSSYTGFDYKEVYNSRVFRQLKLTSDKKTPLMLEKGDGDFGHHRPDGQLNYRNVDGDLVGFYFTSLDELGTFIGQTKDFHYCVAKRYVKYFTGYDFKVTVKKNESPQAAEFLAIADKFYTHGNQKELITDIFASPLFTQGPPQ